MAISFGSGGNATLGDERRFLRPEFVTQWVILAAALLCIAAVVGYSHYNQYGRMEAYEHERLLKQVRLIDRNLSRQLDAVNAALEGVMADFTSNHDSSPEDFNEHLRILELAMPGVRTLVVIDPSGRAVRSNRKELLGADLSRREYFLKAKTERDGAMAYISPPYRSLLGVWVINVSRAMVGPDGVFRGLVVASLDPEFFEILLSSSLYAPDMWAGIAHIDGLNYVMVPKRADAEGLNLKRPGTPFVSHVERGEKESLLTGTAAATGEYRLFATHTVTFSEVDTDKPLVVTLTRDENAIHAGWRENAQNAAALFAAMAVIAVGGLWLYQHKRREAAHIRYEDARLIKELSDDLNSFFENSTDMLSISSMEGVFTRVNGAWAETLGVTPAELSQARLLDFAHPDDREATAAALEVLADGKPVHGFLNRCRRNDGSYRWIEWNSIPYGGSKIFSVSKDVTERLAEESEREELINSLKSALENVKTLKGLLPMCAWCRKIRNDSGYWQQIESYVSENFDAEMTHGICPDCAAKLDEEVHETKPPVPLFKP